MDLGIISLAASALSGALAFGSAWGIMRGKMVNLEDRLAEAKRLMDARLVRLENASDEHTRAIHAAAIELTQARSRVSDIAELKSSAVRSDVFNVRMNAQDDVLNELRMIVDRKVSVSNLAATPPPMRQRLPSRPAR